MEKKQVPRLCVEYCVDKLSEYVLACYTSSTDLFCSYSDHVDLYVFLYSDENGRRIRWDLTFPAALESSESPSAKAFHLLP
jgi:hypothetical protein